jgi:hypothetical protein
MRRGVTSEMRPAANSGMRSLPWRAACGGGQRSVGGKTPFTRAALVMSMLLLASCGFQPLHSQSYRESQALNLSSIAVVASGETTTNAASIASNIPRRYSELLRAEIEDQVNPAADVAEKLFTLTITFTETDVPLFVKPDGTASRGDLTYYSTYVITRTRDGKQLSSGAIQRVSSYNTSSSADYASYVSIEDARKRGILELAQDYKLRLAVLLPALNAPDAAPATPAMTPAPALQPSRSYETFRAR